MGRLREVLVTLRRNSPTEQWGFSLVGGADVKTPLIVTRIGYGSPADGVLHRGDIITKVGNYDARDIRHQDAQALFRNSGNNVRLVVQRDQQQVPPSRGSSSLHSPLSISPGGASSSAGGGVNSPALSYAPRLTPLDDNYFQVHDYYMDSHHHGDEAQQEVHVTKQPYRTTPLILPGAKVKREPVCGTPESYLRHHPNPAVRAAPLHHDYEYLHKQKVADSYLNRFQSDNPKKQLLHKQFNSPINLYSEPNVVDTIKKQTGVNPIKKHVKFNPTESETYKALQEDQLIEPLQEQRPHQSKVYTPIQHNLQKPSYSVNQQNAYSNSIGGDDTIHQSGSFRRLMLSVLPETSY